MRCIIARDTVFAQSCKILFAYYLRARSVNNSSPRRSTEKKGEENARPHERKRKNLKYPREVYIYIFELQKGEGFK